MAPIKSESQIRTQSVAKKLGQSLKKGTVLAFYGDLGAGKTTFVQGLAKGLGINKRIISPTFVIMRSYRGNKFNFHHVDLYRLNSEKDVVNLGILELFDDPKNIIAIEWAEKMENMLPQNTKRIYLKYIGEKRREILIEDAKS